MASLLKLIIGEFMNSLYSKVWDEIINNAVEFCITKNTNLLLIFRRLAATFWLPTRDTTLRTAWTATKATGAATCTLVITSQNMRLLPLPLIRILSPLIYLSLFLNPVVHPQVLLQWILVTSEVIITKMPLFSTTTVIFNYSTHHPLPLLRLPQIGSTTNSTSQTRSSESVSCSLRCDQLQRHHWGTRVRSPARPLLFRAPIQPTEQRKFREAYREIQVSIELSSAVQLQTFCGSDRSNHGTTSLRLTEKFRCRLSCQAQSSYRRFVEVIEAITEQLLCVWPMIW